MAGVNQCPVTINLDVNVVSPITDNGLCASTDAVE